MAKAPVLPTKTGVSSSLLGQSILGTSVSIAQCFYDKILYECMEGPLTDLESSDEDMPSYHNESVSNKSKTSTSGGRRAKQKERTRARRRDRRAYKQAESGDPDKQVVKKRKLESAYQIIGLEFAIKADAKITLPAWVGKRQQNVPQRTHSKDELLKDGMQHLPWDGKTTHLLIDKEQRIVGVLLGKPRNTQDWDNQHDEALSLLHQVSQSLEFSEKQCKHRRGQFPALAHGISFGGGQQKPKHISHGKNTLNLLDNLLNNKSIQRLCNYASSAFQAYSKRNYDYMAKTVTALRTEDPTLQRSYDDALGVFPCRSFNLGTQSISYPHLDDGNLAQSWCTITPIGKFDYKTGGNLVLWDFGLVIDFPPGTTIMIPSALLCHSNTTIAPGETRFSLMQYAAGGLFRWVENGFMSEKSWMEKATVEDLEIAADARKARWEKGVDMFTKLEEILSGNK